MEEKLSAAVTPVTRTVESSPPKWTTAVRTVLADGDAVSAGAARLVRSQYIPAPIINAAKRMIPQRLPGLGVAARLGTMWGGGVRCGDCSGAGLLTCGCMMRNSPCKNCG